MTTVFRRLAAIPAGAGARVTKRSFWGSIYDERELARLRPVCDEFVTPGVADLAIKMGRAFGEPVATGDYALEVHAIVDGVTGFLFPLDEDEALPARLGDLLREPERCAAMGHEVLRTVRERVNISLMIGAFRGAIQDDLDITSATHGPRPGPDAPGG